jgi:hemerythrin
MAFLEWSEKYSMGMDEIDEQHHQLFVLLNRLHKAVVDGAEQGTLGEILDELIDYTVNHFETEENLFKENNYPEYEAHKNQHDDLTGQVVELQNKFREGSATISFEVLDFLSEWLTNHTLDSDQKYVVFMNSK